MSAFEITTAPVKFPFIQDTAGKESGIPGRAWLPWLSSAGDGLAGLWGTAEAAIVPSDVAWTGTGSVVYLGRAVSVNVRLTASVAGTVPATIDGLPKALEKSILSVVLLGGSGSVANAIIAAGATSATLINAGGTANEILLAGIYRTR